MRIKRVELVVMAPGNKRVLRRFRMLAPAGQRFTAAGAQKALDSAIDQIDNANPNHKWRLVALGNWKYKLVWDEIREEDTLDEGTDQVHGA